MKYKELLTLAEEARGRAYAPYSGFTVGAALLCGDGEVFIGCNIENASFTPTCCAERVALFSAVAAGKRDFSAIAVAGGKEGNSAPLCMPCGVCRQALSEFCPEVLPVILEGEDGDVCSFTLGELLPHKFSL
ncbi:MAG: cytidine deaminase [Clostridia bacterium]|nr:cytidine deaminase [Clostridia bacterium]